MDFNKPSMDEGSSRFWSAVFGGVTAVGLVAAGVFTVVQYLDSKAAERAGRDKDREAVQLQIATTEFSAKQAFNSKHLELCAQAAGDAGTIATTKDPSKRRLAQEDFWQLYWGPLGIVEETGVANAMVAFGQCIEYSCEDAKMLALKLAHACREEVSKDFHIVLPTVPERPAPGAAKP